MDNRQHKTSASEFSECCIWKTCPESVGSESKYILDSKNLRVATKTDNLGVCTVIGNTPLPLSTVSYWAIKFLEHDTGVFVGVAPSDIDQDDGDNHMDCGWYLYSCEMMLYSGPPQYYWKERYGESGKGSGKPQHAKDAVGIVMDTAKGELSFVVNGVNLGVAFDGIPLDKPLVPCVLMSFRPNSVQLDFTPMEHCEPSTNKKGKCVIA